jgi:hypothetical protein
MAQATISRASQWTGQRQPALRPLGRRITLMVVGLLEVLIIVLALQLTLGIGYEGLQGPMPAPTPMRGF